MKEWIWYAGGFVVCSVLLGLIGLGWHPIWNVGQSLSAQLYACRALHKDEPLTAGTVVYYVPSVQVRALVRSIAPAADLRLGWLKQIAAIGGDEVCWENGHILVNHQDKGALPLLHDYPLSVPSPTCQVLHEDEVLPMGVALRSFDGRYSGPITREEIQDVCRALF
jgi:type IV secretory pathway protease TraF